MDKFLEEMGEAEQMRIARAMLCLAHSYLGTTSTDESEEDEDEGEEWDEEWDEEGDEEGDEEIEVECEGAVNNETKYGQNNEPSNKFEEFKDELIDENKCNKIEKEIYQESSEIQVEFDMDHDRNQNTHKEFNVKLHEKAKREVLPKFNRGIQVESHKNVYDNGLQIDSFTVDKLEGQNQDLEKIISQSFNKEKQQISEIKEEVDIDMEVDSESQQKSDEILLEENKETQQMPDECAEILLQIEVDNSFFQQGSHKKMVEFDRKKLSNKTIQIELNIEVTPEFQPGLDENKQNEFDKSFLEKFGEEKQLNNEKEIQSQIDKEIQQKVEKIFQKKSISNEEFCKEKQQAVENINQPFYNKILVDSDLQNDLDKNIQNVYEEKQQEIDSKKSNEPEGNLQKVFDENVRINLNNKNVNYETSRKIGSDFQKLTNNRSKKEALEQLDEEMLNRFNELPKAKYDGKKFTELDLEGQNRIYKKFMELFRQGIQQNIENPVSDDAGDAQFKKQAELIKQIEPEIEELQKKIDETNQDFDIDSFIENLEPEDKAKSLAREANFLEIILPLFQDSLYLTEKIEEWSNMFFPKMHDEQKDVNEEVQPRCDEVNINGSMQTNSDEKMNEAVNNETVIQEDSDVEKDSLDVVVEYGKAIQETNDGEMCEGIYLTRIACNDKAMELIRTKKNDALNTLQFNEEIAKLENEFKKLISSIIYKNGDDTFDGQICLKLDGETKEVIRNESFDEIKQTIVEQMEVENDKLYVHCKNINKEYIVPQGYHEILFNEFKEYINNGNKEKFDDSENESDVCVDDDLEEKIPMESYECIDEFEKETSDDESLQDTEYNEINEVLEVVEDYETEFIFPVNNFNRDEEPLTTEESSLKKENTCMKNESGSMDAREQYNRIIRQNLDEKEQVKLGRNKQKLEEKRLDENYDEMQHELEDLPPEMASGYTYDDDDATQELSEEELHEELRDFQQQFYKDLKSEYENNQRLNAFKVDSEMAKEYDEQQKMFYELLDEFKEIEKQYKTIEHQQMLKQLYQETDEDQLLEMEEFSEEYKEHQPVINQDFRRQLVELRRFYQEIGPEFQYNIPPLDLRKYNPKDNQSQKPSSKPKPKKKKKRFDLFEKLYSIHRKKLIEYSSSKEWPTKHLYPSGLLDALFEDPLEFKPHVLLVTLYSIDIGYSVKITMKENEPPIEIFYSYLEDTVLKHIENEELPIPLLELLDNSERRIFYNGCLIAEIHDFRDGCSKRVYRVLLRPTNKTIFWDVNYIIENTKEFDWTYQNRLKLERDLLLMYYPNICTDISPIASKAIILQQQLLNLCKIQLNPLNMITNSKLKSMDLSNNIHDNESRLSSDSQNVSSNFMDTENDNIFYVIWKFDFRLQSYILLKLYILIDAKTQEFSILLCMNSNVRSVMKIRFKINLEKNNLTTYINTILDVLKQKLSPDIVVVRRFKYDYKSEPHTMLHVPTLLDDNIYEPNCAVISELINKLLEYKPEQFNKIKTDENESSVMPNKLSDDFQKIERNSFLNKKIYNDENTKHNKFSNIMKSSKNLNKNLDHFNMDLREYEFPNFMSKLPNKKSDSYEVESQLLNPIEVESSSLHRSEIPLEMFEDFDTISLPKENSIIIETNSYVGPPLTSPISFISLDDNINVRKKSNSMSEMLSTTEILPSNLPLIEIPTISTSIIETSTSGLLNIPSVSSPITVLSSLSSPITVIASVPSDITLVSSITSNMSSSESSKILSKHEANSVVLEHQSPTIYDVMKTSSSTLFTQPLSSERADNISVIKHTHDHEVCLKGLKTEINPQVAILIQKNGLAEEITLDHQLEVQNERQQFDDDMDVDTDIAETSNLQVTLPNVVPLDFSNIEDQANTDSVLIPYDDSMIPSHRLNNIIESFGVETMPSINNLINEDPFQEINSQSTSSDNEDYEGIK